VLTVDLSLAREVNPRESYIGSDSLDPQERLHPGFARLGGGTRYFAVPITGTNHALLAPSSTGITSTSSSSVCLL